MKKLQSHGAEPLSYLSNGVGITATFLPFLVLKTTELAYLLFRFALLDAEVLCWCENSCLAVKSAVDFTTDSGSCLLLNHFSCCIKVTNTDIEIMIGIS